MSGSSAIEWTDATWNPVTGCTRVSPGCAHCYIERTPPFRMAGRRFEVVDAFKWGANDDGGLFAAWRQAVNALGYDSQIVWLNSMFAPPTPQSRDRMYVVFWLKGIRRPNLKIEPPSWCPACEQIVAGQQTWKKPDRPWGRYGAQYLYGCPTCHKPVLPGVFPAASAIDWSLPAVRIGERPRPLASATRERIRRGLERLASEPFAIRLLQGGAPRPLTLPLVTLTQRHDLAVVLPVSGNTFERTPGNRARDARTQPMDTVHGTLDRAIVVPYSSGGEPKVAVDEPIDTLTRKNKTALVMANTENGVPRPAKHAPAQTLRTEGGLSLVYSNRAHAVARPAHEHPAAALCTGGHLGVIVRQNTARGDAGQMSTPAHEPFRTLTAACHQSLVVPYQSEPHGSEEPARTLTTRDRLALVVPPMGGVECRDADTEPGPTQTTTTRAALALSWNDADVDSCLFRMFALEEIARTMAMEGNQHGGVYEVLGNKRERMAQYGNAVTPPVMRLLVERLAEVVA